MNYVNEVLMALWGGIQGHWLILLLWRRSRLFHCWRENQGVLNLRGGRKCNSGAKWNSRQAVCVCVEAGWGGVIKPCAMVLGFLECSLMESSRVLLCKITCSHHQVIFFMVAQGPPDTQGTSWPGLDFNRWPKLHHWVPEPSTGLLNTKFKLML